MFFWLLCFWLLMLLIMLTMMFFLVLFFGLEGYEGVPMDYSEVDWEDFFSSSSVSVYLKTY